MKTESLTPVVQRALVQLGQTIRIARKKRRMNVEDFADRLGVTKGTVIRLERGEAGVSIGTLWRCWLWANSGALASSLTWRATKQGCF
jgi:DNA-binding XRE family transcriptional regulator